MVCAEGKYLEGDTERRAAIFIGPEFGTVQRQDLVQAAREAGDANFDVLIACAFNYEAHATEFNKLGRIAVLKARMNADLHMAEDLKNTGKGNLFVIFGEPDIGIYEGDSPELKEESKRVKAREASLEKQLPQLKDRRKDLETNLKKLTKKKEKPDEATAKEIEDLTKELADCTQKLDEVERGLWRCGKFFEETADIPNGQIVVVVFGVDVFRPNTGEVQSDGADGIACWFIDTDYNDESFFVRHAYFLGASDPYKSLKTTLKAEINVDAWESLHSDTSRPFAKPKNGKIAVKVINHLGDEVMKVFRV
jgi:adenine-specific DNA-methyltransferase